MTRPDLPARSACRRLAAGRSVGGVYAARDCSPRLPAASRVERDQYAVRLSLPAATGRAPGRWCHADSASDTAGAGAVPEPTGWHAPTLASAERRRPVTRPPFDRQRVPPTPAILGRTPMRFHHVLLIVNPVARTVSKPTLAVIEKALSADFRLEVSETKERGHANELAAQAVEEGIDLVVVFSGDGTINEAVNALAGTETALGVIPGGATNILARALDLPTDPVEATGVLITKALDDEAFRLNLGTRRRPLLRGQLRRRRGRRRDASSRRQVPEHEGEVRSRRVPRGRLGAADRLRRALARPGGQHRRSARPPRRSRSWSDAPTRTPTTRTAACG